jgi:hypothetical protein
MNNVLPTLGLADAVLSDASQARTYDLILPGYDGSTTLRRPPKAA